MRDVREIQKQEVFRRRSGETISLLIRRCGLEDLSEVLRLQERLLSEKEVLFQPLNESEYRESLALDCCFGAYSAAGPDEGACGELAGFTMMIVNRDGGRNYANYLDYPEDAWQWCVSMDLTMVAPAYRGYGLQRYFTALREETARALGAKEALVTISPDNLPSLRNLQSAGFEILCTRPLYGGKPRHILRKDIGKDIE